MADEADDPQDDVLELTDTLEPEAGDDEPDQQVDQQQNDEPEYPTFDGDPDDDANAPELVRHLRQQIRDRDKRIAALARKPEAEQPIIVGERPRLADYDWDEEKHNAALDAWDERREARRQQDQKVEQARTREAENWQRIEQNYQAKRAALPYADKDQAQAAVSEQLTPQQRALIMDVAADPALFEYAAFKNPARLAELAAFDMNNPREVVKFAATVGRMGATLTMRQKTKAPPPQESLRGGVVRQGDAHLAKLEKAAATSGDRSEVVRYKAAQRAKGA